MPVAEMLRIARDAVLTIAATGAIVVVALVCVILIRVIVAIY